MRSHKFSSKCSRKHSRKILSPHLSRSPTEDAHCLGKTNAGPKLNVPLQTPSFGIFPPLASYLSRLILGGLSCLPSIFRI